MVNTETPQSYVDLTRDAGFKTVLGSQSNKELLIGILNYILPPQQKVRDIIEYLDREQDAVIASSKVSFFDLTCKGEDGSVFIIEMQNHRERDFFQRCVYYGAIAYGKELDRGSKYTELRPVYVIAFLNYDYIHDDESRWDNENFIAYYSLMENRTKEIAPSTIYVYLAELRRFTKTKEECQTERDWLFYLFKSINSFDDLKKELDMKPFPLIQKLETACKLAGMTKVQHDKYDQIMRDERDYISSLANARDEGIEEGLMKGREVGLAEGMEKGIEKGIEKGKLEGRKEGKEELAKSLIQRMLSSNLSIGQISSIMGMSEEKINAFL